MSMSNFIGGALLGSGSSNIGSLLNNITGKAASAKQAYKYSLKLQKDAQEFSKWQMANAHQEEVKDLENAGLNPVLSAGGSGASAGVYANSGDNGGAGIDPLSIVAQAVNMMNSVKQTNAQVENLEKENDKINAEIDNIDAQTRSTDVQTINETTKTKKQKRIEKLYKNGFWGSLAAFGNEFFGGNAGGTAVSSAVSARNANKISNAMKSPKITTTFRK